MKYLTIFITLIFSISVSAIGHDELSLDWNEFLFSPTKKEASTNKYPNLFIEDFPFFIIDENTTIFDVCVENDNFKNIHSGEYVRSTYQHCTQLILDQHSLRASCKMSSIKVVPIPRKHSVNILQYVGAKSNYRYDPNYRHFVSQKRLAHETLPPVFLQKAVPFEDGYNLVSIYKGSYRVPDCEQQLALAY